MYATMADAHYEWHANAGVPMGQPGCPMDACHLPDPDCPECGDTDPDNCPECIAAAARCTEGYLAELDRHWRANDADPDADPWGGYVPPF